MASDKIRMQDLQDNPDIRVPVGLCLDTSGSMNSVTGGRPTGRTTVIDGKRYNIVTGGGKSRLEIMQEGIQELFDAIFEDENARYAAEICIVTFDSTAKKLTDFSRVEYEDIRENPPKLTAQGQTAMGEGLNLALSLLEKRKEQYRKKGVTYCQPWLVLITDGENNGSQAELDKARSHIREMVLNRKLAIYPFHIGNESSLKNLEELSPLQKPMKIGAGQMKGMFQWLSRSVAEVSSNTIGSDDPIVLSDYEVSTWNDELA